MLEGNLEREMRAGERKQEEKEGAAGAMIQ